MVSPAFLSVGCKTINLFSLILSRMFLRSLSKLTKLLVHSALVALEMLGSLDLLPLDRCGWVCSWEEYVKVFVLIEN